MVDNGAEIETSVGGQCENQNSDSEEGDGTTMGEIVNNNLTSKVIK